MKLPFHLVPDDLSHDIVVATQQIAAQAMGGEAIGIAFIVMYRTREFIANAAGEYYRNPDAARGHLAQLHDALGRHGRGEEPLWG